MHMCVTEISKDFVRSEVTNWINKLSTTKIGDLSVQR